MAVNVINIVPFKKKLDIINSFPAYATVYLAKKNCGSDQGKLYALKVVNLTFAFEMENQVFLEDILINEREVMNRIYKRFS